MSKIFKIPETLTSHEYCQKSFMNSSWVANWKSIHFPPSIWLIKYIFIVPLNSLQFPKLPSLQHHKIYFIACLYKVALIYFCGMASNRDHQNYICQWIILEYYHSLEIKLFRNFFYVTFIFIHINAHNSTFCAPSIRS